MLTSKIFHGMFQIATGRNVLCWCALCFEIAALRYGGECKMAAARSSGLLHRVDSDFESQLAYNCSPALIYGLIAIGLGLIVFGLALSGNLGKDALWIEVLSAMMMITGVSLCIVRLSLVVDRKLRRVTRRRSAIYKLPETVYNLTPFDFLTITCGNQKGRVVYEIGLTDSSTNFTVAAFPNAVDAREFAHEIANFLNVRIVDTQAVDII